MLRESRACQYLLLAATDAVGVPLANQRRRRATSDLVLPVPEWCAMCANPGSSCSPYQAVACAMVTAAACVTQAGGASRTRVTGIAPAAVRRHACWVASRGQ